VILRDAELPPRLRAPISGTPGNGTPDNGTPGNGTLGNGTPGNGTPGNGTPGNGTLGNGTPGNGTPDNGTPGNGTPDNGTPGNGTPELRRRLGVPRRAFTGSALKPQGLSSARLAALAERFAHGGLDFVKDDHGLADQAYSRFAERVPLIAAAVRHASATTGLPTRYIPSLTGDLDQLRDRARIAREEGLDCMMLAPMVSGFPAVRSLIRDFPDVVFFAHPAMGGAARISPELLIGKLFPALGCGAVIFPVYGGRFGYSRETCRELADNARPALAVPAGGITLDRIGELLDFHGRDTMLLIGGSLLLAKERITEAAAEFAQAVARHGEK
jgi:ribulose-bisphosphate carboxylase large chain